MSRSPRVRTMPQSGGPDFVSPAQHQAARRRKRIVRTVIAAFAMTASTFVLATAPSAQAASNVPIAAAAAAPTVPGDFGSSINCALVVTLHWTASTDDVGVTGYDVYRSISNEPFTLVRTTSATTFTESLLGVVKYQVRARDAAGNVSGFTAAANIVPPPCPAPRDTQPPSTPGPISPSITCTLVVTLSWGPATDNVAVIGYDVYRSINNGPFTSVATTPATTFTESLLGTAKYQVRARDTSGNVSAFTTAVLVVPPPCPPPTDTQPPTTPGTPTASGTIGSATTLTWPASTDNVSVAGYDIYRASGAAGDTFAPVGTSTSNAFTDTSLTAGTTYRYQVRARDAAGNVSAFSATVAVTTPQGGCSATLNLQTGWHNGYVLQPNTVTNSGTSDLHGWTVTFTLPSGHTITGSWNAVVTVTGQTVTVRGIAGQNAILGAGATTTWGLQAERPAGDTALPSGGTCTSP